MQLNGKDAAGLKAYVERIRQDPTVADRDLVAIAHWEGDSRARVEMDGRKPLQIGGDDDFNSMAGVLGMLAACDVDVMATHATLIGLELSDLRVEVRGHFNVASYLGLEAPHNASYQSMTYRVVIDAPTATDEQIAYLKERCERSSPVGDSLQSQIPLTLEFEHRG